MPDLVLRPWRDDDGAAAAALTARCFAPDPAWTADEARAQLRSSAVGGGAHVIVAERGGEVVGVAGYVAAPPWLYLWPVMAADGEAVAALLDAVVAAGRAHPGVTRARVSVRAIEPGQEAAVRARGYARSIDFLELVRPAGPLGAPPPAPPELTHRTGAAIDRAAMRATHDRTFAEIPNTAPMSAADFDHLLDGPNGWPAATAGWFAADGTCAGFVIGVRQADHGVVEAIGVDPAWRRRGLAAVMLAHLLAAAEAEAVPEVRAMIADSNAGSLGVHAAAGFRERTRKQLWDLAL